MERGIYKVGGYIYVLRYMLISRQGYCTGSGTVASLLARPMKRGQSQLFSATYFQTLGLIYQVYCSESQRHCE